MESLPSLPIFCGNKVFKEVIGDSTKIVAASFLLILASKISFFLPFTPVHVTLQTAALFFIGATLGSIRGVLAVLLFLAEGTLGLPVFASGKAGLAVLLGPTGGYYIGFLPAVAIAGIPSNGMIHSALIFLVSNAAIFFCGLPWLALFVGFDAALPLGFYPFILGDLLKIIAAAAATKGISVRRRC